MYLGICTRSGLLCRSAASTSQVRLHRIVGQGSPKETVDIPFHLFELTHLHPVIQLYYQVASGRVVLGTVIQLK